MVVSFVTKKYVKIVALTKVDELVLEKVRTTLYCAQLHLMFSADHSAAISRDIGSELEIEGGWESNNFEWTEHFLSQIRLRKFFCFFVNICTGNSPASHLSNIVHFLCKTYYDYHTMYFCMFLQQ